MQDKFIVTSFNHRTSAALIGGASSPHFGLAHHASFGVKASFACDAVVDHIDHTTNSTPAIQQGGRATQNFNALRGEWVNRHCVVVAQGRHVHVGTAVLQDANAVTIHATNHRSPHIWAKRAVGNAR